MAERDEKFERAVEKLLSHEGGYVNDPDDPGGETCFGISKRFYPDMNIKGLTREKAEKIYFRDFWVPGRFGEFDQENVAEKIFDLSVNMGLRKAAVILQLALVFTGMKVTVDGIVGPETIGAVNGHPNELWLLDKIRIYAIQEYLGIGKVKYLKGWIGRALD